MPSVFLVVLHPRAASHEAWAWRADGEIHRPDAGDIEDRHRRISAGILHDVNDDVQRDARRIHGRDAQNAVTVGVFLDDRPEISKHADE